MFGSNNLSFSIGWFLGEPAINIQDYIFSEFFPTPVVQEMPPPRWLNQNVVAFPPPYWLQAAATKLLNHVFTADFAVLQ